MLHSETGLILLKFEERILNLINHLTEVKDLLNRRTLNKEFKTAEICKKIETKKGSRMIGSLL